MSVRKDNFDAMKCDGCDMVCGYFDGDSSYGKFYCDNCFEQMDDDEEYHEELEQLRKERGY